jgi:hypothetical protein
MGSETRGMQSMKSGSLYSMPERQRFIDQGENINKREYDIILWNESINPTIAGLGTSVYPSVRRLECLLSTNSEVVFEGYMLLLSNKT